MPRSVAIAKGKRGSWLAKLTRQVGDIPAGTVLPCIHKEWWDGNGNYCEPFHFNIEQPRRAKYVAALMRGRRAIMTTDRFIPNPDARSYFERTGYVGVFRISDVTLTNYQLSAKVIERVE